MGKASFSWPPIVERCCQVATHSFAVLSLFTLLAIQWILSLFYWYSMQHNARSCRGDILGELLLGGGERGREFFPGQKDPVSSRSEEAVSASISVTHVGEINKIHCHRWHSIELLKNLSIISINDTNGRVSQRSHVTPELRAHREKLTRRFNPCYYSTFKICTNFDLLIGWFVPRDTGLWLNNFLDVIIVL